ncbi:MAG TPA: hypothetical protein VGQ82_06180 [Chthoniobacterales bacterium]|nr:hypothetical protein [Chthoniobacterales bacterium]
MLEKFELRQTPKTFPVGIGLEDNAAGNRVLFGGVARNETIADKCKDRRFESKLRDRACASLDSFAIE